MKYTPENITELNKGEVFVFGSNTMGIHGAGAAKLAMEKFDAKFGVGCGPTGRCYAIPTKDNKIQTLPITRIKEFVDSFLNYAKNKSHKTFLVTKIGCGLAGLKIANIAPMFKNKTENVILPEEFHDYI